MRLNLLLSPNVQPVPFDHLHYLTGALHKWIGRNELHDGLSLYSFGWLRGGRVVDGALTFPRGARWWVSFHDLLAAKACLRGMLADPEVICGMRVLEVQQQGAPGFKIQERFWPDGIVVARQRRADRSRCYLLWDDPDADAALTRTLRAKLEAAGYTGTHLDARLYFDRSYQGAKTKVAAIKGVRHKGSLCPVVVEGTPEAVGFAFAVGAGELTGSGFGGLQLTLQR